MSKSVKCNKCAGYLYNLKTGEDIKRVAWHFETGVIARTQRHYRLLVTSRFFCLQH